jgi:hypothetical protein
MLREQKHFIYLNVARMIQGTFNGQDTNQLYLEVCKLAVCQWKLQKKLFLGLTKNPEPMDRVESRRKVEMSEEHTQCTSSKRVVLTDDTPGKERAPTSTDTGDLSGKQ